jgi:RNA polymerase sigma-70 factor, ECF subfamily
LRASVNHMDEQLLIEAAQRDSSRFAELYENNFDRVYAYIAYRVHNREEAQDLTAEVFHHALAKLAHFEWRGVPFVAWLLRIAANTMANRWHRTSREEEISPDAPELAAAEFAIDQRIMLTKLVDMLPEDQRLVIVLRFIDQRSIRDIARELGRSEGAVKQLQFRALQALRTRIRSTHV